MTPQEAARAYIDRVLESQRELGYTTTVSSDEYERAIGRATQALADLSESSVAPEDGAVPV